MHTIGDVTHRVTGYKRLSKISSNISQYYLWQAPNQCTPARKLSASVVYIEARRTCMSVVCISNNK